MKEELFEIEILPNDAEEAEDRLFQALSMLISEEDLYDYPS